MKKKLNVVTLPTNSKSNLYLLKGELFKCADGIVVSPTKEIEPQYLYIVDFEEEKLCTYDWCIDNNTLCLFNSKRSNDAVKVIATNQPDTDLPNLPDSFLKDYCKIYDRSSQLMDEVLVEYVDNGEEDWIGDNYNGEPFWNAKIEPALDENGNIIVEFPVIEIYESEEYKLAILEDWMKYDGDIDNEA